MALGSAALLVVSASYGDAGTRGLDAVAYVLLVAAGLALGLRRRVPEATLVVVLACLFGYHLRDYPEVASVPVVLVAVSGKPLRLSTAIRSAFGEGDAARAAGKD